MSLDDLLGELEIDPSDPAIVFVHLVSPRFEFTSKAKTEVVLPPVVGETIGDLVTDAAKRWTKQKRKLKADRAKLKQAMTKPDKTMTFGEALRLVEEGHGEDVMTRAYLEASAARRFSPDRLTTRRALIFCG
jgi:DNA topoisomerase VI subunit B